MMSVTGLTVCLSVWSSAVCSSELTVVVAMAVLLAALVSSAGLLAATAALLTSGPTNWEIGRASCRERAWALGAGVPKEEVTGSGAGLVPVPVAETKRGAAGSGAVG